RRSLRYAPRLPHCTLFPYTTLFRSSSSTHQPSRNAHGDSSTPLANGRTPASAKPHSPPPCRSATNATWSRSASSASSSSASSPRSEEHTSELQSRENLVCRLLLEKK